MNLIQTPRFAWKSARLATSSPTTARRLCIVAQASSRPPRKRTPSQSASKPAPKAAAASIPKKAAPPQYLTLPLQSEITEILTSDEPVPPPLWGSWSGTVAGLWVGTTAAFAPFTGQPEPIALGGENGKTKLLEMSQCCVEERVAEGDDDLVVRHTARAATKDRLEHEMAAAGEMRFDPTASMDWDVESMAMGQDGLFIYDGGSYSSGPLRLFTPPGAAPISPAISALTEIEEEEEEESQNSVAAADNKRGGEDEEEDDWFAGDWFAEPDEEEIDMPEEMAKPPGQTSALEACLQFNGEQRIRVRLALTCHWEHYEDQADTPPELDISLLRVSVSREGWEGMPGRFTSAQQPENERAAQQVSAGERLKPQDLAGFWNEFEVSATTVEDIDMRTGLIATLPVYSSRGVQRLVSVQSAAGGGKSGSGGVDGGALWLPHKVAVQLTMAGDRSLELSVLWCPEKGLMQAMKRRYNGEGQLDEVISVTGIQAK